MLISEGTLADWARISGQAPAELRRDSGGAFTLTDDQHQQSPARRRVNSTAWTVSRLVSITKCERGPAR